jgi:hypothetical protein
VESMLFLDEHKESRRADLRTADLLQLRVRFYAPLPMPKSRLVTGESVCSVPPRYVRLRPG